MSYESQKDTSRVLFAPDTRAVRASQNGRSPRSPRRSTRRDVKGTVPFASPSLFPPKALTAPEEAACRVHLGPRVDEDLRVRLGVAERVERIRDAVEPDGPGDERARVDLALGE